MIRVDLTEEGVFVRLSCGADDTPEQPVYQAVLTAGAASRLAYLLLHYAEQADRHRWEGLPVKRIG